MKSLSFLLTAIMFFSVGSALGDRPHHEHSDRYFYLTRSHWEGSQGHEACADGYHFASAFELLQVSNFIYNTELGHQRIDSGYGPPAYRYGWLRNGAKSAGFNNNCGNCVFGAFVWFVSDPVIPE